MPAPRDMVVLAMPLQQGLDDKMSVAIVMVNCSGTPLSVWDTKQERVIHAGDPSTVQVCFVRVCLPFLVHARSYLMPFNPRYAFAALVLTITLQ